MKNPHTIRKRLDAISVQDSPTELAAYAAICSRDLLLVPTDYREGQTALRTVASAIRGGYHVGGTLREFRQAIANRPDLGDEARQADDRLLPMLADCERLIAPSPWN